MRPSTTIAPLLLLVLSTIVSSAPAPAPAPASFKVQNGLDAQKLDNAKANNKAGDACTTDTCCGNFVCLCSGGKLVKGAECGAATPCQVLPLVNKKGTSVACDTEADKLERIKTALAADGGAASAPAAAEPAAGAAAPAAAKPAAGGNKKKTFITDVCKSDDDCQSGCCGFKTGKCAGAIVALERDNGCGFGEAQSNNNAAIALGFKGAFTPTKAGGGAAAAAAPAAGAAGAAGAAAPAAAPAANKKKTFITDVCKSDDDCQSGCCGFKTGKCAGAIVALERDNGCGFGEAQSNNNAAIAL
ncbi:hypothetical protein HDU97_004974, partial [Phlyctochytrium planicorne]